MSILEYSTDLAGQTAVHPRLVRIVSNDSYATITTLNWLRQLMTSNYLNPTFYDTDIFFVAYGEQSESVGLFTVAIDGANFTLLPFYGDGITPSNPDLPTVASVDTPVVIGNLPAFQDTLGTIEDSGISESDIVFSTPTYNNQLANVSEGYNQGGIGSSSVGTNLVMNANTTEIFNTTLINELSFSFNGAAFDGKYIYFCPNVTGQITRYNTRSSFTDEDSYSFFDTTLLNPDSYGYSGAVFDGRYIYFSPLINGDGDSGVFLRYDTHSDFLDDSSYSFFDLTGVNANSTGFNGAVFDGRYIYLIPFKHPVVTRYDTTKDFNSSLSYSAFDLSGVVSTGGGFVSGVFDGRYIYFSPSYNINTSQPSGILLRYDSSLSFTSSGSYASFDVSTVNVGNKGFGGVAFDGRYVYLIPFYNGATSGQIARYDTTLSFTSINSYSYFDTATINPNSGGFNGAVFDGKYLYLVPFLGTISEFSGIITRYDVTKPFLSATSYAIFDATTVNPDCLAFNGGVYDGRHVYFSPYYALSDFSGQVFRMKAYSGPQILGSPTFDNLTANTGLFTEGVRSGIPDTGTLNLTATPSLGAYATTISNRAMAQNTTFSIGDPGQGTASILTSKVIADVGANLISFDVTVTSAALPSSSVVLYQSSGTKRYKIRSLQINAPGTNFSGVGGDRNLAIADNTSIYSLIPAATLQSLTNAVWGSTDLPLPALVPVNTSTAAGESLIARYSGGTTDYSAGSIVISGILERVA